jgi:long-chain acyl-CoA synthetase
VIHPARYHGLGEILQDAFLQYPSETATIEVDRHRELGRASYADTRLAVARVAAWLAERGLGPDSRVAIVLSNQTAWLVIAAAALHLGCVLVPLDSRLTPPEQSALLRHARPQAIVLDHHLAGRVDTTGIPTVLTVGEGPAVEGTTAYEQLPHAQVTPPLAARTREHVACIVYSSGTGGEPKGCQLTHGNYLAQYQSLMETFEWRRGDRYLSILPTNHAIDFMCGFLAAFCTGCTVIHQRTLRPATLVETMRRYRITQMAAVPLILEALERGLRERLDELERGPRRAIDALTSLNRALTVRAPRHDLSRWLLKPVHDALGGHLRVIFCGGAFTPRPLVDRLYELGLPVAIGYGLTEACTVVTVNDLKPFRGDTVGSSVPGVRLRIHDPDPDGVGEVQVSGPTVFAGYLDAPELTAAAFDGPWLRTGDLGWLDAAHHLHLVGRSKDMIVTAGGKNVYPDDVEQAFATLDCEELAIFAEDYLWPRRGLGGERLVAVIRPRADASTSALLTAFARLNRALPDYKRVSSALWWPTAFPRTASMKVRRNELVAAVREHHDRASLTPVNA